MSTTEVAAHRVACAPALARELLRATRAWAMYPASHPAATVSIDRLHDLLSDLTAGGRLRIGVTPRTLTVDDAEPDHAHAIVGQAARMLHERDILRLTFETHVSRAELRTLLGLLTLDAKTLRERGGPARIWHAVDRPTIGVEQLDYRRVMERSGAIAGTVDRDDRWTAIVRSMLDGGTLDADTQQQVIAISHDAEALEALVGDVQEPICSADGSPIVTAQAAAVLCTYRQMSEIVNIRAPDAVQALNRTVAEVSRRLPPAVIAELLQTDDDLRQTAGPDVRAGVAAALDTRSLGALLAEVATRSDASNDRLGRVVRLLDGQPERTEAVLAEARTALSRRLQDQPDRLRSLWGSIEGLADRSNGARHAPASYGVQLSASGARAHLMAGDLPDEREAWVETVGPDPIRRLTLTLLADLLRLDPTDAQADGIVDTLGEAAEDLLAAGDHGATLEVVEILTTTRARQAAGHRAAAGALQRLATGTALLEAAELLDTMDAAAYDRFRRTCLMLGPSTVDMLRQLLTHDRPDCDRLVEILRAFGDAAIDRLAPLAHHPDPETRVRLARLLGRLAMPRGSVLLEPLLRSDAARVSIEAMRSLLTIGEPGGARLIYDVLRTSDEAFLAETVAAIAARHAPESAPLLVLILSDCRPLGPDHALVLRILAGLRQLGDTRAVAGVSRIMRHRSWLRPRRSRALRRQAIQTLLALPGASGRQAVTDVRRTGDRQLRRLARQALGGAPPPAAGSMERAA